MTQNVKSAGRPKTITAAVLEAATHLEVNCISAEERALAILKKAPGQPEALALLVSARRLANDLRGARDILAEMASATPKIAAIQYELGKLLRELGENGAATAALSRAVALEPSHARAWRTLGDALSEAGRTAEASLAYQQYLGRSVQDLERLESADKNGLNAAEATLREWLKVHPADVIALKLLGSLYLRLSRHEEAEEQLSSALALAPQFEEARWLLVGTFVYRGNWNLVLSETEILLEDAPDNAAYLDTKAFALLQLGDFPAAVGAYETLLAKYPTAENWKSYGRALKAIGRATDAVGAYRQALALKSDYGMAYWCLAELKTFRFEPRDIEAMSRALDSDTASWRNRAQIHFALGRAYEDARQYDKSFDQYRQANAAVRTFVRHDPEQRADFVRRNKSTFLPEYFHQRSGWGSSQSGPIFIIGLPRSGSTLVEQILASHSLVEATNELQTLEGIVREFERRTKAKYPEFMQSLPIQEIREAGERYLERSRVYRRSSRPFFIDKMPNNFSYIGTILTSLPHAKVIDVRRHPLGSGFAIFKHYFVDAYSFAFDLTSIGRYYRSYVELIAHFDSVLPSRVHRVCYEDLVADPEQEIRKLLRHCGLPFEEQCLRFYEGGRAVLTPSSEQVRRPISGDPALLWRRYERWLDPLKSGLGDVLDRYPEVPDFAQAVSLDAGFQQRLSWASTLRTPSGNRY